MNWIIRKVQKLQYHTNLQELFKPIYSEIDNHNWVISDFEFNGCENFAELPINYKEGYFVFTPERFKKIIDSGMQMIWGVILGVPHNFEIAITSDAVPYVEGNPYIFEDGHLQYANAVIEIVGFDSSYTIVKFTNEAFSNKFKEYFDEAVPLDNFRSKHIKG